MGDHWDGQNTDSERDAMSMWTAIFGIVAIGCITGAISSYYKARASAASDADRQALEERLARAERTASQLEERVRTLERVVTDGSYDLKREFNRLEG